MYGHYMYYLWVLRTSMPNFLEDFWMTTSENQSLQICMPTAKAVHTGFCTYSNKFFEGCLRFYNGYMCIQT